MATPPTPSRRTLIAAAAAVALVVVVVVSPNAATGASADVFTTLNRPGEAAFVAGHRGDKDGAPENTIPAFQLALASDAEFVETDLQLTKDGVPVLMHDWTLDRTTNGTGPVWNRTWEQVSALDAGSWYSDEFTETRVPSLDDLLDLVRPPEKSLILELKGSWTAEQLRPVAEQIHDHGLDRRVIVASFDIMSLSALRSIAPDLRRAIISRTVVGDPAILAATCDAVAIVTSKRFLEDDPAAVDRIHAAGLGVLIYTLNSEDAWADAIALGVDGIITDKPAELEGWLDTSSQ